MVWIGGYLDLNGFLVLAEGRRETLPQPPPNEPLFEVNLILGVIKGSQKDANHFRSAND